ncbi:uncharacterized protein LOC142527329 isoform X1 [Primulina tabacum]|uniref:uncharacterized protein LOC142527329 isoform X1 n=1 Tax=Primulina tabacum TaxID=48773 RepID=UPI003F59F838
MLADKQEDIDVDDFVKLYIIFVFNCILFPTSNCTTPRFLLTYVDDLSKICNYAWGNAAYRFLNEEILKHVRDGERRKKYFDGCVIGLKAWLYERIPSLGKPCALHIFPRFFRWVDSKIPNDLDAASVAFLSITKNKVLPIYPLPKERILVRNRDNDNKAQIKRLDAIIRAQEEEIREMKRTFHVDNIEGKNRVSKGKGRRYTEENDDLIPRDAHEFDEFADESLKFIESGDKVPFNGYDGGSDLAQKRRKSVEESDEYMTFEAHKFDAAEKLNAFEIGDKVSFEVYDGGHASERKSEKYVDTDGIENEQAIEDSDRDRVDNNIEVNSKSDADKEEKTELKNDISSIARDVMSRQDRRLKGKEKDFVTPPSTTPKKNKRKLVHHRVADKPIELENSELVVTQIAQAAVKEANQMDDELLEYVGRSSISDSDRNIVDTFLKRSDMREEVWRSMKLQVSRQALCDLLYDKELMDDVINAHLNILSRNFVRYGNPPKI